jgi:hypothetical protein
MTTAELGCDINNIQILENGVRPALRERKIQRSLYLTAQLTVFVFAQDKSSRVRSAQKRPAG